MKLKVHINTFFLLIIYNCFAIHLPGIYTINSQPLKSLVKNVFYYLLRIIYTFKYVAYTFSGTSIMQVTTLRYHQFGGVRVTSLGEKIYKY